MTSNIMYAGVGANAGKTVFTRAHCRLLSDRGHWVSPFKPVAVTKRQETRGDLTLDYRLWILGAAARCRVDNANGPVQIARTGPDSGQLRIDGRPGGRVPLMAVDTPLFDADLVDRVVHAVGSAYRALTTRSDVVIVEGSGSCVDLVGRQDPANTFAASLAAPAIVLIAGVQPGGAVAALRGTWSQLPDEMRRLVVGFALNDVAVGAAILEKGARKAAAEAGVAFLGALPHTPIYDDPPPGQHSALRDVDEEYNHLAALLADNLDVATIHRRAGLDPAGPPPSNAGA